MFDRLPGRGMRSTEMREASANLELNEEFRIMEEHPRSGVTVLAVSGEADLHTAPELRERMQGAIDGGSSTLLLDLSGTTFLDSTTLGVLFGGMKQLRERNGSMQLVVPQAEVRRVLEITQLDRVFSIHDTREEALADSDGPG